MRQLLHELNRDETLATPVHIDNQGALKLIANRQVHARTKHLDIRYMSIRELEANGVIETKYIGTEEQLADLLTKALYRNRFSMLRGAIKCTSVNMIRQENDNLRASNVNLSTTCSLPYINRDTVHQMQQECKIDLRESCSATGRKAREPVISDREDVRDPGNTANPCFTKLRSGIIPRITCASRA